VRDEAKTFKLGNLTSGFSLWSVRQVQAPKAQGDEAQYRQKLHAAVRILQP
jgi:hypothetical protein